MKTNEHIIKEFEKVNTELRKQLRELEAEKQGLEQMFQAQQELLNQRNSVIAELESELSVKEGLLNIKNGLVEKILFPCENTKIMQEILNVDTENIQDDVHRFGIEYCQKHIRENDRKKEFNEICDMFNDYMEECNKGGVIRFLAELTQKLRDNGVAYTVESLGGEINVKDIETGNPRKITVSIDGIPKGYAAEKICEIVRAYEDIKHCEERAGEHLYSEEHLKIINLRQETECLKRNSSKKDELIKTLKKDSEEMKKRMMVLNDKYQSDCIEKTQLHTALDVMTEKYQRLREIHGL